MFQAQDAVSSTKVRVGGLQGEREKATVPGCLGRVVGGSRQRDLSAKVGSFHLTVEIWRILSRRKA